MSSIDSVSTVAPPTSADPFGALTSGEFLNILITELSNQDPLSPSETKDVLEQVSVIRSIESNLSLQRNFNQLIEQSEVASAGNLIGKYVVGRNDRGQSVESFVGSVTVTREGPVLNLLNGQRAPFDQIEEIFDPALFATDDAGDEPEAPAANPDTAPDEPDEPDGG